MKRLQLDLRTLSAQMILSFIALVWLMAVAALLPAVWLTHRQLEHQAWAQVERGGRAAQALYAALQEELKSLATLTAQRPTLRDLVGRGDGEALLAYLRTLQQGSGLDLVLVCQSGQAVAQAGRVSLADPCARQEQAGSYLVVEGGLPQEGRSAVVPHTHQAKRLKSHRRGLRPGIHLRGCRRPRRRTASRRLFRCDFQSPAP